MAMIMFPYTNLHELNLDWIIEQLGKDGPVTSVNGEHGIVVLTGADIARSSGNSETVDHALTAQGTSIQSVQTKIGVTTLPTTAQTITGAIAEHETDIGNINTSLNTINNKIGNTALPTIADTLTGAIAENAGDIADIDDLIGSATLDTSATTLIAAINEVLNKLNGIYLSFGSTSMSIIDNLGANWTTVVPNDSKVHLCRISAQYGDCYGYICRYANNFGSAFVTRYDGAAYAYFMSNGTITGKNVTLTT